MIIPIPLDFTVELVNITSFIDIVWGGNPLSQDWGVLGHTVGAELRGQNEGANDTKLGGSCWCRRLWPSTISFMSFISLMMSSGDCPSPILLMATMPMAIISNL